MKIKFIIEARKFGSQGKTSRSVQKVDCSSYEDGVRKLYEDMNFEHVTIVSSSVLSANKVELPNLIPLPKLR